MALVKCTPKCPGWDDDEETCWMGTVGYCDNNLCYLTDKRLAERLEEVAAENIALKLILKFRKTKKWAGQQRVAKEAD